MASIFPIRSTHFFSLFPILCFLSAFTTSASVTTGSKYFLDTSYAGSTFFNGFTFYSGADPTSGFVKPDWPNYGEIDIIEGVNSNSVNLMSLHTISGGVYATECIVVSRNQFSGEPQAAFEGACGIDTHFGDHQIVINTDFCGSWGGAVWQYDAICAPIAPDYNTYVAENPEEFAVAYWEINYVNVYTSASYTSTSTSSSLSVYVKDGST
ncbi:hypothetical protein G7Y89_g15835 [Cudoniella acicularis]|uniref:Uncharacterized protein n=1 Tax=Cudoniella acicularis TaxID=354080 RepID=A0A8H4QEL3_9HELO|nr:hypothetical protein G7Y89_g15835 [Cudoniella acicularis]